MGNNEISYIYNILILYLLIKITIYLLNIDKHGQIFENISVK